MWFCLALGQSFGGSRQQGINEIKPYTEGRQALLWEDRKVMGGQWKCVLLGKCDVGITGENNGVGGGCKKCWSRSRRSRSCRKGLEGTQRWQWGTEEAQLETNWKLFLKIVPDPSGSLAGWWVLEFMTLRCLYSSLDTAWRSKMLPVWMSVYPRLVAGDWKGGVFTTFCHNSQDGRVTERERLPWVKWILDSVRDTKGTDCVCTVVKTEREMEACFYF